MGEVKKHLVALIRGKGSLEQTSAALDRWLTEAPDRRGDAAKLLKAAREAGLPENDYKSLADRIDGSGSPSAPTQAPAAEDHTVRITEGETTPADADRTVVLDAPGGRGRDDDAEATVVADDGERTDVHGATAGAPVDRSEAATEIGTGASDDATVVGAGAAGDAMSGGSGDEDATAINVTAGGDDDRTVEHGDPEAFDILSDDALAAAEAATASGGTGADWPTAAQGAAPATSGAGITRDFREGDRLRNRYELISKLGEGGMGAVWKGKDLLKEEARDRNPYVAIKLLQGDFKEHPESFIALQREAAKQQRLAHPNIATVYDFDRDDHTNTVFMTMEVLEGTPLDSFIRKLPAGGLAFDEAMPLIEQLSQGLAYAHQQGLVHSDLKPGNAFLTKEGNIKLLDFGIARASKTKTDAEGETTLFDPGQLGALTPTYATIEMFEGQDPDQRDDIYALAIMAYQMLTGKHPYGKKSAPKAKELGLKPEPVQKLNKRQNRALGRALAFHRDDRTPDVEDFLEGVRPRKSRAPMFAAIGAVLVLTIAGLSYSPVMEFLAEQKREEVIAVIQQPGLESFRQGLELARDLGPEQLELVLDDERVISTAVGYLDTPDQQSAEQAEQTINATLDIMDAYPQDWYRDVLDQDRARASIVDLYETKIFAAFDPANGKYDFQAAQQAVAKLDELYPDSATVFQIRNTLVAQKEEQLKELSQQYTSFVEEGRLLPQAGASNDIGDVLSVVREIDPEHRLLEDDRLRLRFGTLAEQAIQDEDYQRADAILEASVAYAPEDPQLKNLRFQVQSELQRIEDEKRVAAIERRLEPRIGSLQSLSDFQSVRDDLLVLADLSPQSPVLTQIQANLKDAFASELGNRIEQKDWQAGEQLLVDFARLLEVPYVIAQRERLSRAESEAGFELAMSDERRAGIQERVQEIERLLAEPEFTSDWEIDLKVPYKELIALVPEGDASFEQVRNKTARLYLSKAREARESGLFAEARTILDKGEIFYPGLKDFATERTAIAQAEEEARIERERQLRLARIDALKNDFRDATKAEDVKAARETLAKLEQEGVSENDPFMVEEAPTLVGQAYLRLAQGRVDGENQDWEQALALARAGLQFAPDLEPLVEAEKSYAEEVRKRALEIELRKLFASTEPIDVDATSAKLDKLEASFPDRFSVLKEEFAQARGSKIRELANARSLDIPEMAKRIQEYQALFPDSAPPVKTDVTAIVEKRIRSVDLGNPRQVASIGKPLSDLKLLSPQRQSALVDSLSDKLAGEVEATLKKDLGAGTELWQAAVRIFPEDPALRAIEPPPQSLVEAKRLVDQRKLGEAQDKLAAAKEQRPGHRDIAGVEQELQSLMSRARAKYEEYVNAIAGTHAKSRQAELDRILASARNLWDNPAFKQIAIKAPERGECYSGLAGKGDNRRAECWDKIGRRKGPPLVVVPAGGGNGSPFAISKYEISGDEFDEFCKATKACDRISRRARKLPITGITVQQAEQYAKWLSEQASEASNQQITYRLPTEAEWEHAAKAGGGAQPQQRGLNCRVTSGGSIIKGHDLVNAESGDGNAWGLTNYVGNAQEWVRTGSGVVARGGSFEDQLTECQPSISRSHSGQADKTTGFRLVRELG